MIGGHPSLDTWSKALVYALDLAAKVPDDHRITQTSFGEFHAGGFYVSLAVVYSLGNTVGDQGEPDPARRKAARDRQTAEVIEAWTRAAHPTTDRKD